MSKINNIKEILKFIGWVLLICTGLAFLIWGVQFLYSKFGATIPNQAGNELDKRIKAGKKVFLSDYESSALAEKFYTIFNWNFSVTGAKVSDLQPLLMRIKTYGDYLKVVSAYGIRAHAIGGQHKGSLDFGAHDQTQELTGAFYDSYIKALKANDK